MTQRQLNRLKEERVRLTNAQTAGNHPDSVPFLRTAQSPIELAQQAERIYKMANVEQKRKLLEKVLSNSSLSGVTGCYQKKKPFVFQRKQRVSRSKKHVVHPERFELPTLRIEA